MQHRKLSKKEKFQQSAESAQLSPKSQVKEDPSEKTLIRSLGLIIAMCAFLLYSNTLSNGFVLDDYSIIVDNKVTTLGWKAIPVIFKTNFHYGANFGPDDLYRPLTKSVFAIQWALSPANPALGHWMNVLLFALTGMLLFQTLYRYSKGNKLFAFIAALLFVAHPIHTEVVANIKSLDEILGLLFSICALRFIFDYTQLMQPEKLIFASVSFFLALMSKESSITFIGVFPLAVYFFTGAELKNQARLFFVMAGVAALFLFIRIKVTDFAGVMPHSGIDNLLVYAPDYAHRFATAVFIMGLYIKLFFFPHPLVFDYSFNQIPIVSLSDYRFIISFILFIALAIVAVMQFKKKSWFSFGILFFFITAAISSNVIMLIGTSMAERLMFVPSLGWCIVAGNLISRIVKANHKSNSLNHFLLQHSKPIGITFLIVIVFSVKTISRNKIWKDNLTLFSNDVELSPNSARTHYYLGNYIKRPEQLNGKTDSEKYSITKKSINELKTAVTIAPDFTEAWNQLGVVYDRINNRDSAIICYRMALAQNPDNPTVLNNIGTVYFKNKNYKDAVNAFTKATAINPEFADAFANLGTCYAVLNNFEAAIVNFKRTVEIDPGDQKAFYLLAAAYEKTGNIQQAQFYTNKAASLNTRQR